MQVFPAPRPMNFAQHSVLCLDSSLRKITITEKYRKIFRIFTEGKKLAIYMYFVDS